MPLVPRLRSSLRDLVPADARRAVVKLRERGDAVHCPVCDGDFRRFLPYGEPVRPNRACPGCGSLRRHRILWLYLVDELGLGRVPLRLLHLAPEKAMADRLRRLPELDYVTFDLREPAASVRGDLTRAPFASGAFDVVICSHVLEHIPDDRAAMQELCRVLAPDGTAVVLVPVRQASAVTDEDPTITSPEARLRAYGHRDHVRYYGRDVTERLAGAGFAVDSVDYAARLSAAARERTRVAGAEPVYACSH
jgi:SAM-dependent methyltransferase